VVKCTLKQVQLHPLNIETPPTQTYTRQIGEERQIKSDEIRNRV
jgi:hypothetical protein